MLFSLSNLQALFGTTTLLKAEQLLTQEQLAPPDIQRNGQLITSIIHLSAEAAIRIYIRIEHKTETTAPAIQGECSHCGKGTCHHIVAVLLKGLADHTKSNQPTEAASQSADKRAPAEYPPHIQQRLLYRLFPIEEGQDGIGVATSTAKLNKDGEFTHLQHYEPCWASSGIPPRYLLKRDLELLSELDKRPLKSKQGGGRLHGSNGQQMLYQMLKSGRTFIGQLEQRVKRGPIRCGELQWQLDKQGNQQLILKVTPKASTLFLMPAAHYLDQSTGECGEVETTLPTATIEALLHQPTMNPEEVNLYYQTVMARYIDIPAPHSLKLERLASCQPIPHLSLTTLTGNTPHEQAKLTFDYGGGLQFDRKQPSQYLDGKRVVQVIRQKEFEESCAEALQSLGLSPIRNNGQDDLFALNGGEESWLKLQHKKLPQLKESGWQINIDDHFRYRLTTVDEWFTTLEATANGHRYHFSFGVQVGGKRINLLPALVQLLKGEGWHNIHRLSPHHCVYITLESGQRIVLPLAKIRPIIDNLFELFQPDALDKSGHLPLSKIQLARLNSDNASQHSWFNHHEVRSLVERLRLMEHPTEVVPPTGLQATLRDYQLQGLAWLQFLRDNELAGILADEMGLGKTIQSLAHILMEKEQGRLHHPCLIIAPTSLVVNWRQEAKRFAPDLKVLVLHGQARQRRFADIPFNDLIITTYPLLLRDYETHGRQHYHLLILDEAQTIKNSQAKASQLVREIPARYRLCLTGTPMENHLGELWSLFDFLLPGLLGSEQQFQRVIRNPIEKSGDPAASQRLAGWLRPFMLRRTKQAVATELPEKTEIIRNVALTGEQQALYERIRRDMQNRVKSAVAEKGVGQCRILILNALLRMRQVCCDPRLLGSENSTGTTHSGKLELLMEMLPTMVEEGRRILLFSQFTGMLELIEAAVKEAGIPYAKLTGKTRNRAGQVEKFQNREVPLFLISLKAGGVGLNLTSADSVIHYDPWWNPAVERQATDRAHRIGQSNPVFVYKLITADTVEEKIQAMQARKQQLADNLFEQADSNQTWWSETDLDALFEPLKQ